MDDSNNYWYDIEEKDGSIVVNKIQKENINTNEVVNDSVIQSDYKRKSSKRKIFPLIIVLVMLPILALLVLNMFTDDSNNKNKYRTFMIYMVGSDLESEASIASFDLNDIEDSNIDLDNINVLLMVGGSKKWHNFVDSNEIGLYELRKSGFKKIESYSLSSMGTTTMLSNFLNYTTDNYKSEKYDLVFWNHGLGAAGLEDDEIAEDYINIVELDKVFEETKFKDKKMELVIFNNCLSGNIHFANIMGKYAEYMVASEEIMYVGAALDRLNFLEDVKKNDNGYDIGLHYVERSDNSVTKLNSKSIIKYDSTLSILDLSKVEKLDKSINEFFDSIDVTNNYRNIARSRMLTYTYGEENNFQYDTVDLYELVSLLAPYSNNQAAVKTVQNDIKELVSYNSALNTHSNGIAIYFPFFGSETYINTHLYYFEKIWDNGYTNFINNFYSQSSSAKRANRSGSADNINHLENEIIFGEDKISIQLNDKEKESFQKANIYIFDKENDDNYKLLLKSNDYTLNNDILTFDNLKLLKTSNDKVVSSIYENEKYTIYGQSGIDLVINVINNNGNGEIESVVLDSKNKSSSGIVDISDDVINYYELYMNIVKDDTINEEYEITKEPINNVNNDLHVIKKDLDGYYVLIEMFDENNDTFYSKLTLISRGEE